MRVWGWGLLAACQGPDDGPLDTGGSLDLSSCEAGEQPEVFLGKGVGGAFELLEEGQQVGLSAAPQGGLLVGTRGLQAGEGEIVTAELTGESQAVEGSAATFSLSAALQCKTDGPGGVQGVIYGVVVGFASSLGNSDLLEMNGQTALLSVSVTDAAGATASVDHPVTLVVGQ
jgi:hypothetical protein